MPHRDRQARVPWSRVMFVVGVLAGAACASNPAPDDWLPSAREVPTDPFGAWIQVRSESGTSSFETGGELLAVEADTVFLLSGEQVVSFSRDRIDRARVAWFESGAGALSAWTVLGSLLTLSNGYIGGITLPLWIITGTITTSAQTRAPIVDYRPGQGSLLELRAYARFPQGFPPGLDRSTITGREVSTDSGKGRNGAL